MVREAAGAGELCVRRTAERKRAEAGSFGAHSADRSALAGAGPRWRSNGVNRHGAILVHVTGRASEIRGPRGAGFVPMIRIRFLFLLVLFAVAGWAAPSNETAIPVFGSPNPKGGLTLSTPTQIVILLTLLTLLPAVVMSVSPFLRIVIVLHFLRQALGTQSAPSNQVLVGLSLF